VDSTKLVRLIFFSLDSNCISFLSGRLSYSLGGYDSALDLDIETYIHGDMYHVDGIVFGDEIKLCWPSKYSAPCGNFRTSNYLASYSLHKNNPLTRRLQVCYRVDFVIIRV
jgi:hypothetical protein